MSNPLLDIRAAVATASDDLHACLRALYAHLLASRDETALKLFAQIDGDLYELEMLKRRESAILANGRDPGKETA